MTNNPHSYVATRLKSVKHKWPKGGEKHFKLAIFEYQRNLSIQFDEFILKTTEKFNKIKAILSFKWRQASKLWQISYGHFYWSSLIAAVQQINFWTVHVNRLLKSLIYRRSIDLNSVSYQMQVLQRQS